MIKLDMNELREVIEIALDRELHQMELDSHLYEELGMDSIGAVAMVVEIQRRFKIRIDESAIPGLLTPRLLAEYVNRLSNGKTSPESSLPA